MVEGDHGIDEGMLDRLEEAERPLELLACIGVLDRGLQLPFRGSGDVRRQQGPDGRQGAFKRPRGIFGDKRGGRTIEKGIKSWQQGQVAQKQVGREK